MPRALALSVAAIALVDLLASRSPGQQRELQRPTAAEASEFRASCAQLGEEMMRQGVSGGRMESQTPHYNPLTNRCYIEITVRSANGSIGRYLFDPQSRVMLMLDDSGE